MYAYNNIDNFENIIYGLAQQLESCDNSVIQSVNKSWVMKV